MEYRSFSVFNILKSAKDKKDKKKVELFVNHYIDLLDNSGLNNIKDNGTPLLNRALFCPALKKIDFTKKTKLGN